MGTTPNYAIPYPEPTDFVTDGATAMESIAEKVDDILSTGAAARNLLYNGAIQVCQRSTSAVTSITSSGYFTADRWNSFINTLGTWTQTPDTDVPSGQGFRRSFKMTCTTADASPAAGDFIGINQKMEGQDLQAIRKGTASAQPLTVSFWVKSNKSGTYICELFDADNNRSISRAYVINATGTWEYKTVTFTADTTGVLDNDSNLSMEINWWLAAGSTFTSGTLATSWASLNNANRAVGQVNLASDVNNYWQMTGIQMTIGSVATPFQFKSYQQELAECQRYYWKWVSKNNGDLYVSVYQPASTPFYYLIPMPVTMRARPNSASLSGSVSYVNTPAYPSVYDRGDSWLILVSTVNSGVSAANQSVWYSVSGSTTLIQDAELS
jgi:hypothetical protein